MHLEKIISDRKLSVLKFVRQIAKRLKDIGRNTDAPLNVDDLIRRFTNYEIEF